MAALLAKVDAPVGKDLRGDALSRYIVVTGSDGYSAVFSIAEVDPSFHQGQVILADSLNGKSLGDHGPFQLVVTDDKRPARWVHNVVSISVQTTR